MRLLLLCIVFAASSNKGTRVDATVYNPSKNQTDSTPYITASGIKIDTAKLRRGKLRYISISRNLRIKYKYKTFVTVISTDTKYNGKWYVVDTMNRRFTNKVDFLQHKENKNIPPKQVIIL